MTRDEKLSCDNYERWTNGRFAIARYSQWNGIEGTFFQAYDLHNLSRRISERPLSSFDEALALCNK